MSPQEIEEVEGNVIRSPYRRLLEAKLSIRKLKEEQKLGSTPANELLRQQGIAKGLEIAIGIINSKDTPSLNSQKK